MFSDIREDRTSTDEGHRDICLKGHRTRKGSLKKEIQLENFKLQSWDLGDDPAEHLLCNCKKPEVSSQHDIKTRHCGTYSDLSAERLEEAGPKSPLISQPS